MVVNTHNLGLLDDSFIDNWSWAIAETLATPGGQQYWEKGGRGAFEPQYVKVIEDYIENNLAKIMPYNNRIKWMLEAVLLVRSQTP